MDKNQYKEFSDTKKTNGRFNKKSSKYIFN